MGFTGIVPAVHVDSLTLKQAVDGFKSKAIHPKELLQHYYEKVDADARHKSPINAVVHLRRKDALKEAERVDSGTLLAGAPILIKDNMHMKGEGVECCSNILKGYVSPYTGGACERLLSNGAIVFGRTNMDEFAMGSSNETSAKGLVRNPINRNYTPGGSSGGSAASVGAGFTLAALGSDTGGSIRQPAACCGIVGLKPTYGRVSRYGLVAFASSLDQIGPMTKTVEDSALLLRAVSGHDPRDSTSVDKPVPNYPEHINHPIRGKVVGLPKEFFPKNTSPSVVAALEKVIQFYKDAGCAMKEISIPTLEYALPIYYVLATAEASANLARYDGIRYGPRSKKANTLSQVYEHTRSEGFGDEVKRRILTGTYMLSSGYYEAYYIRAQRIRGLMAKEFADRMKTCDLLLAPTMMNEVFGIGEKATDPIQMYLSDILTTSSNLTGLPSISLPCGKDSKGLPISFQLIARPFEEALLLNSAHLYEKEHSWRFD